jgi:hypothetical protein
VGVRDQGLEKEAHHEFELRGSFRLSVSPDRRKNESASLRPLSLCGDYSFARPTAVLRFNACPQGAGVFPREFAVKASGENPFYGGENCPLKARINLSMVQ